MSIRAKFKIRESPTSVATAGSPRYKVDGGSTAEAKTLELSGGPNIDILSGGDDNTLTLTISTGLTTRFNIDDGDALYRDELNLIAGTNTHFLTSDNGNTFNVEISTVGAQGHQGYQGLYGGDSQLFEWDTNTSSTNPGTGKIKINNSALSGGGTISVNNSARHGVDVSGWLSTFDSNTTNPIRGSIKLFKERDASVYVVYNLYTINYEGSAWHALYVQHVISNGNFTAGDSVVLTFTRYGDKGDQGYQGYQGDMGYQGYQGYQGFQGYQGNIGISGNQGYQGEVGDQGERGYTGPSGGEKGDTGDTGATGATGLTGPRGLDSPGPTVVKVISALNTFKPGDIVRYDGFNYVKSVATSAVSSTVIGVVSSHLHDSAFNVVTHGYIDSLSGVTYANQILRTETIAVCGTGGGSLDQLSPGDPFDLTSINLTSCTITGSITYNTHHDSTHGCVEQNRGDYGYTDTPSISETLASGWFSSGSLTSIAESATLYNHPVTGVFTGNNDNNIRAEDFNITNIPITGYIDKAADSSYVDVTVTSVEWPTNVYGLEPGEIYYLRKDVQGEATSARPTDVGEFVKPLMYAVTNSSAYVNIQSTEEIIETQSNSNIHTVELTAFDPFTGHDFNVGAPIFFDGTDYQKSHCAAGVHDANDPAVITFDHASAAEVLGIVQSKTLSTFTYVSDGSITFDINDFSMAPGSIYFLSPVSGILTTTEPFSSTYISKPVLYSISQSAGLVKNYRGIVNSGLTGPVPQIQGAEDPLARNNILLLWMENSIREAVVGGEAQDGDHDVFLTNTLTGYVPDIIKYQKQYCDDSIVTLTDSSTAVQPALSSGLSYDGIYDVTNDLYHNKKLVTFRRIFGTTCEQDKAFTVPIGLESPITTLSAHLWGAGGGGGGASNVASVNAKGGPGGYTYGEIAVSGGESLTLIVGRGGDGSNAERNLSGEYTNVGTYYGGGAGASNFNATGAGGGRTAIRKDLLPLSARELITAGGGGGGGSGIEGQGGAGNGGTGHASGSAEGGGGGTNSINVTAYGSLISGGSAAAGSFSATPLSGIQFAGGAHSTDAYGGAGGGGGYYGGGGGAANYGVDNNAGGGGGGSGHTGGATNAIMLSSNTTTPPNTGIDQYTYNLSAGIGGVAANAPGIGGPVATGGNHGMIILEYSTLIYANMSLSSVPVDAMDPPNNSRVVFLYKPEHNTTLNVDIKLFTSRNDGLNWEEATLANEGMYDDDYHIVVGTTSLSSQPVSSIMRWKIQTYNNKYQKIRGVSHLWS